MSASRLLRAAFVFALFALFTACEVIADFDSSKLPKNDMGRIPDAAFGGAGAAGFVGAGGGFPMGGTPAGGTTSAGGAPDGAGGFLPEVDASFDASLASGGNGTGAGGAGGEGGAGGHGGQGGEDAGHVTPPVCDVSTNVGCAADELCCALGQGVTCRKTTPSECEQCGVACPAALTSECSGRSCECVQKSGRVCSGQDAEKFCNAGPPIACVGCRDSTDCAGRTDGKGRCVSGQCAACDPMQASAGCSGNTPICDATTLTCKACSTAPNNCPAPLLCTAGGACGHCVSATDCSTLTSPICDATTTQCRPCASNAECVAGPKLPYCVTQVCSSCNPANEAGCTDPTKPDCRGDATGGYSCQQCANNTQCAGHPTTPVCDANSGRCVVCAGDNDCKNAKTPLCVNNACVACDASSGVALVSDLRCALKAGGQPACIRTGTQKGQCGACDPNASRGCTANQLCCESAGVAGCVATTVSQCGACGVSACDPLVANACSGRACKCGTGAPCTGTGTSRFCVGTACAECRADADCTNPAAPLCEGNACVGCDAAATGSARCGVKQAATVCATKGTLKGHCAACDPTSNAGCTDATLNACDPATATCVDCVDDTGCSGTFDKCNVATQKCIDCNATGGCSGTLDRCNLTTGTCIDCDATGGCTAPLDKCNLTTSTCVDCDATGGCAAPLDKCDLTTSTCVDCDATGGCAAPLDRCNVAAHSCVDCDDGGGCGDVPATPVCVAGVCAKCTTDAQCVATPTAAGPLCTSTGACVPDATCAHDRDCTDGVHVVCSGLHADGGGTGRCRACDPLTNDGCTAPQKCSATFVCAN
ncbi:MAG TPA: hypothetical protein VH062_11825 [Polyangiaceae bacterium]|jgi:hypothetical protein|nr:hypothetical protein [Polyangiaceae bacterium]